MDPADIGYVPTMTADVLGVVGATVVVLAVLMVIAASAGFLLARLERRRARRIHADLVKMRDERRRRRW